MICANKTQFLARKLHVGRDFPTSGEARANYFPPFFHCSELFLFVPTKTLTEDYENLELCYHV